MGQRGEFFDEICAFDNRKDFFDKVIPSSVYYNFIRKNSHKYNKSPLDILKEPKEDIDLLSFDFTSVRPNYSK